MSTTPPSIDALGQADSAEEFAESVRTHGFALLRQAIDGDTVERVRQICDQHLHTHDQDAENEIEASKLLAEPTLAGVIFNSTVTAALTHALGGTLTYYPNYVVRLNRFTTWHVDNGFLPQYHGEPDHLYDPDFRHLQAVVYLQDNEPGAGGGLDVVAGSHNWARDGVVPEIGSAATGPDHSPLFDRYGTGSAVDSRAGDLLVFDGRLLHRGSPSDGSATLRKYGIFFSASRSDPLQVSRYAAYLGGRGAYMRSQNADPERYEYMLRRYDDVLGVTYPSSYRPETVRFIDENRIGIADLRQ